ncbi:hypothetical protein O3P69_018136 [Scylla paramamosain]|uniref:Integrase catalytic domain-containing protein n=1 Tax=Scylla paramamosain TaxID=85552 RepID=A0AAW0TI11_SCYPA
MRKDIRAWVRSCLACQTAKNHHHTRTPLQPIPTECFHTVHMDLIGPLLSSRACRYLLTCVDRTTRWGTAIPMPDSTAETTPTHFLSGWVSHFSAPVTIITSAYYPQSNGMVERFHRRLKEAMRALPHSASWMEALLIILLTLRATEKDIHHTPAELVYGEDLHLPGQFVAPEAGGHSLFFLPAFRHAMANLQPTPPRLHPARPTHTSRRNCRPRRRSSLGPTPLLVLCSHPIPVPTRSWIGRTSTSPLTCEAAAVRRLGLRPPASRRTTTHQPSPASTPLPTASLCPALRFLHPGLVGQPQLRRPEGAVRDWIQGQKSSGASQAPTAPPPLPVSSHLPSPPPPLSPSPLLPCPGDNTVSPLSPPLPPPLLPVPSPPLQPPPSTPPGFPPPPRHPPSLSPVCSLPQEMDQRHPPLLAPASPDEGFGARMGGLLGPRRQPRRRIHHHEKIHQLSSTRRRRQQQQKWFQHPHPWRTRLFHLGVTSRNDTMPSSADADDAEEDYAS